VNLPDSAILSNLCVSGATVPDHRFERAYIACRMAENRVYTDAEVGRLPECSSFHPHYEEWLMRRLSLKKISAYLQQKKRPLQILEIGCGNGWLCHQLSQISRCRVTGLDINFTEIQQAARVFNNCRKVNFVYGDIRSGIVQERQYDIILFAASIQYFRSLDGILETCLQQLKPKGEIHIIDSHFYRAGQAALAEQRSLEYYAALGFPQMAEHYFHHSMADLAQFNHSLLYNPAAWLNRLSRNKLAFPWIRIRKD
jgi:ubiquinone/menaquinone biosynthesis C-methylase UbiE